MSYAGSVDDYSFMGKTSWKRVNENGNSMIRKCLLNKEIRSGGAVVVPGSELVIDTRLTFKGRSLIVKIVGESPAVSLFMWASESMFDIIMNSHNNHPASMIPAPGNGIISNWASVNVSLAAQV